MERKITRTIQLAAIAVAAVLFGAVGAISFAGFGFENETMTRMDGLSSSSNSDDAPRNIMADVFALQYADAAQVDYFLKIDGIDGESTDSRHNGEIDVLAWSWGMSQSGTSHIGGGGGAGKVSFSDISLTKWLDKSSPKLIEAVASGKHLKQVQLFGTIQTDKKISQDYLIITLDDVLVSSYQQSDSSGGERPTESISLNFAKIKFDYKPQKPDGTLDEPVSVTWNITENTKE